MKSSSSQCLKDSSPEPTEDLIAYQEAVRSLAGVVSGRKSGSGGRRWTRDELHERHPWSGSGSLADSADQLSLTERQL